MMFNYMLLHDILHARVIFMYLDSAFHRIFCLKSLFLTGWFMQENMRACFIW